MKGLYYKLQTRAMDATLESTSIIILHPQAGCTSRKWNDSELLSEFACHRLMSGLEEWVAGMKFWNGTLNLRAKSGNSDEMLRVQCKFSIFWLQGKQTASEKIELKEQY